MPICRPCFYIAALFTVSSLAWADNLVLNNAAFQTLPSTGLGYSALGSYEQGSVPGWTGSGDFGEYQPTVGTTFNSLPSPTIAFVTGGMLSQAAGTVQANQTYTLSVDVGARTDTPESGTVDLSINGVTYQGVGTAPTPGGWSTYTVTYSALQQDVGAQIYIQLVENNSEAQAGFADVQLDPAPEPSTFILLLVGVLAIYLGMRRCGLLNQPG